MNRLVEISIPGIVLVLAEFLKRIFQEAEISMDANPKVGRMREEFGEVCDYVAIDEGLHG